MPSKLVSALCLVAGLFLCAAPVLAQNYDPDRVPSSVDAQQREACTPDVMRLCNNYVPDIPEIVACLKRQRLNLSAACGDVFGVTEAERQPPAPPPVKDTAKKKPEKKAGEKKAPAKAGAPLSLTTDAAKAAK